MEFLLKFKEIYLNISTIIGAISIPLILFKIIFNKKLEKNKQFDILDGGTDCVGNEGKSKVWKFISKIIDIF